MKMLTVDNQKRIRLEDAEPGASYGVEISGEGARIVLTRLPSPESSFPKVHLDKEAGFTVLVSDRPISQAAIDEALDDFP